MALDKLTSDMITAGAVNAATIADLTSRIEALEAV